MKTFKCIDTHAHMAMHTYGSAWSKPATKQEGGPGCGAGPGEPWAARLRGHSGKAVGLRGESMGEAEREPGGSGAREQTLMPC